MVTEHSSLKHLTVTDETKLWRYCDLTQLLAMLETGSIHFTRADKFADKWEGALGERDHDELDPEFRPGLAYVGRIYSKELFVSCWHASDVESAAMWRLYGTEGSNIAIISSVGSVKESLADTSDDVHCGKVNYIDYAKDSVGGAGHLMRRYFAKRKSFKHEQEVRFVHFRPFIEKIEFEEDDLEDYFPGGVDISADIIPLIHQILVSPKADKWVVDLIGQVLQRYGLAASIVSQSDFELGPFR